MYKWVKKLRFNPRTLKDACRKQIRRCLSPNVLHRIEKLSIVDPLKEYIGIMDTGYYSYPAEEETKLTK